MKGYVWSVDVKGKIDIQKDYCEFLASQVEEVIELEDNVNKQLIGDILPMLQEQTK